MKVIHPDPVSSGGAQRSILSIYGSELRKSESETGTRTEANNYYAAENRNVGVSAFRGQEVTAGLVRFRILQKSSE